VWLSLSLAPNGNVVGRARFSSLRGGDGLAAVGALGSIGLAFLLFLRFSFAAAAHSPSDPLGPFL